MELALGTTIAAYGLGFVGDIVKIILSIFGGLIGVGVYIVKCLGVVKALKIMQYKRPWMGWIPFADYWAMADCVIKSEDDAQVFGMKWPLIAFKFWYVPAMLYVILSRVWVIGIILMMGISFYFLGTVIMKFYAKIEGKDEKDVRVLAYVSGAIPVIAYVKFLIYNANTCFDEEGRPYVKQVAPAPQPMSQQPQYNGAPQQASQQPQYNGMPQQAPQQPQYNGMPQQAPQQPQYNGAPQQAPQQPQYNGMPQQASQQPQYNGMPQQAPQQPEIPNGQNGPANPQ